MLTFEEKQEQLWSKHVNRLPQADRSNIMIGRPNQEPLFDLLTELGTITVPNKFGFDHLLSKQKAWYRQKLNVKGFVFQKFIQTRILLPGERYVVTEARCQRFHNLFTENVEQYSLVNGYTEGGALGALLVWKELRWKLTSEMPYRITLQPMEDEILDLLDTEMIIHKLRKNAFSGEIKWVKREEPIPKGRLFLLFKKV